MATDDGTTPAQLAGELEAARRRLARLAAADDEHRRTEAELRASRERYRRLAEDSPAVVYQFRLAPDGAMSMPFVSSDVAQLSGRSAADVMEDAATLIDMVHPDDRAAFVERIQASARALAPYRHVFRAVREGEILWIEAQSTPIREPGGGVLWHGFFTDVSERVGMEEQLRRANRALATAGAFRRVVNRAETEAELAREVCRILVEVGGYRLAWVGLAEHDDAKTVRPVGHAGCEDGYVDSLEIRWADEERGRGPTGTAIRTAEPVIARFIRTDSAFEPWRAEALRRGYGSSCALPVAHGGEAIGALNVYACEDDAFDEREVALLSELAEDLAQGVQVLKARAEREQAELHRRALEAQLQQAQKLESLGVLASGLAHDFNNLLVGIYGNMDLALHHLDAESPVRECVDRAKTASRRAADLISQMLAYAGQGTTTTEELDLNRLVAEMANLLRASIDKKTTLRLDMPSDLP